MKLHPHGTAEPDDDNEQNDSDNAPQEAPQQEPAPAEAPKEEASKEESAAVAEPRVNDTDTQEQKNSIFFEHIKNIDTSINQYKL